MSALWLTHLELPPLGIEGGKLLGRCLVGVEVDLEWSDLGREHSMGAALGQGRDPRLRIRAADLPATGTGTPEELGVRRGARNVENRAVHRDQPPPPVPGPCVRVTATGRHTRANRARNGSGPSRRRARPIAAIVGTRQVVAHRPSCSSPGTRSRATSS